MYAHTHTQYVYRCEDMCVIYFFLHFSVFSSVFQYFPHLKISVLVAGALDGPAGSLRATLTVHGWCCLSEGCPQAVRTHPGLAAQLQDIPGTKISPRDTPKQCLTGYGCKHTSSLIPGGGNSEVLCNKLEFPCQIKLVVAGLIMFHLISFTCKPHLQN